MFSETAHSSKTKLIGQSLHVSEHGIGYSNLTFEAKKDQKRPIFGFKPLKRLTMNPLKISNFHLALMDDEGHKGQHLVFAI